ncbi:fatty-acyl-CoA synthase [Amycolatopsis arida]|uniref:Fatty-acyl-CoA synthase n=1 Tax=Amycolatopsis arida TaxID=587909 RepID=A0A1I5P296_9PSEU|nr:AMP-binding protein [Amycolatopsis arida]TDX98329.1 fatty-acyl-CoA synthase [Amycolatopsis arida]SFP28175.1 fatty-acyl-CoA synthase [Amycolatopsis arida]
MDTGMEPIAERRARLRARYRTWRPMALHERVDAVRAEHPDRPLVITDEITLRYRDVVDWSVRLADGLWALGVRPGDRVAMVMANHPEFVPLKVAISRAGAVAVPLNFLYRSAELGYVLRQSRCRVLVTMSGYRDLDHLAMLDEIAPGWRDGRSPSLPSLRAVVVLPTEPPAARPLDGVTTVAGLAELGDRYAGATTAVRVSGDDVGDILYTSGTTGTPKGVMVSHDATQRDAYASALTRGFADGRRILFSLPCYHMFGLVEGFLAALFVGGAIIPQPRFDPDAYLAGVERHRAEDVLCVPTMTVALLECPGREKYDLSSLQAILSGAAPAPAWLWERVRAELGVTEIVTGYGMTEFGGATTMSRPEDPLDVVASTVGRIKLAGAAGLGDGTGRLVEYKTVDPMSGADLPPGGEGELACRGPTVMRGYWDEPEETAAVLRDGWVRSGDLGRVRPDGNVVLTGRSGDLYKTGGELVMPKEVEELLTRQPGISQAHVVGVPDERWGEVGVAWIVPEPGAEVTAEEAVAACRRGLARFKVPRHVLLTSAAELPVTPTGKVRKFVLRERAARLVSTTDGKSSEGGGR